MINNDLLHSIDNKSAAALVMLDLSSAFDTIDHNILLQRLSSSFGINSGALSWIKSYLVGRYQSVIVEDAQSSKSGLSFGVPQGSVLGPKLFSLYIAPIGNVIRAHGLRYHCYADDTQFYFAVKRSDNLDLSVIESCLHDIAGWMEMNKLKLNQAKTQFILFGSKLKTKNYENYSFTFEKNIIYCTNAVNNLGVCMDQNLTYEKHVNFVSKSCFYHIRNIGQIRKYINDDSCKILTQSLVISRLDYCNALYYGLPQLLLNRLQRIQNTAARLVMRRRKYEHITPVLSELHWLPVRYRIQYKILLLVFKSIFGLAPVYLSNLINEYTAVRNLRSNSKDLLIVPTTRTVYGERRFGVCGPKLWNALPGNVQGADSKDHFKTLLKTYFFKLAFEQ